MGYFQISLSRWKLLISLVFKLLLVFIPLLLLSLGSYLPQHVLVRQQNMLSVTVSRHLPLWAFQKSSRLIMDLAILAKLLRIFAEPFGSNTSQVFHITHRVRELLSVLIAHSKTNS